MKEVVQLLNQLKISGNIQDYAICGAMAQMRYTEPVITLDVGVLAVLPDPGRMDVLGGIYAFCAEKGYLPEGEAIRVGKWPVQFLPVSSGLLREAVQQADSCELEGVPCRVVRPDYLAAIALSVGRAKDFERILALLECGETTRESMEILAQRHELRDAWRKFLKRFGDE